LSTQIYHNVIFVNDTQKMRNVFFIIMHDLS